MFGLARQARRVAPNSGWPYRFAREAVWLTVESLPEIDEESRTYVRAPRAADVQQIARLAELADWSGLLEASEDALNEHAFWLDLHRYSAEALDRLAFTEARAAVGRTAAALIQRFPRLLDLQFTGGMAFASTATRAWFEKECGIWGGQAAKSNGAPASDAIADLLELVRARAASGDAAGGVAVGLRAARQLNGTRECFRARVQLAELALGHGEPGIAKAISEELLSEINPNVESWAPEEAGSCYQLFVRSERSLATAAERAPEERVEGILKRLLQVDPEAAMRLWR
jgi:type VI secretion system protein VasJ